MCLSKQELLDMFDDLMAHLNGEENSKAEEFREKLEEKLDRLY